MFKPINFLLVIFFMIAGADCFGQNLYTARGYWEETKKETYSQLHLKQERGETLTEEEGTYLADYEAYLSTYYTRLSPEEKRRYEEMKDAWDRESVSPSRLAAQEEFEWTFRDRSILFFYGAAYGGSIVAIAEMESAAAAAIPLIMGGAWTLGPTFNPGKYEGITRTTMRASHTGRLLGLLNGGALGLTLAGGSDDGYKAVLGLATAGSIALGEVGFQMQKKRNLSDGYVGIVRHYGILGPYATLSLGLAAGVDNANLTGAFLLGGGVAGLFLGDRVARRYDYTGGDANMVSTLGVISVGLGFTAVISALEQDDSEALFIVPALAAFGGTLLGQSAVRDVRLTRQQGSNIALASFGAAAIGTGIAVLTESESPAVYFGAASGLALVAHQALFHKYKRENRQDRSLGDLDGRRPGRRLSLDLKPENYFVNSRLSLESLAPEVLVNMQQPVVSMRLDF